MMNEIDSDMDQDAMHTVYARALYSMRETRKALLRQYDVTEELALLGRIAQGTLAPHPAYEHYLAAKIIEQTRMQLRDELLARIKGSAEEIVPETPLHLPFKSLLESTYGARMCEPVHVAQDALLLSFENGMMMEVRYFSQDEFSVRWTWGEIAFCLDTAPVHGCAAGTPHLHRDDGRLETVELKNAGNNAWSRFSMILDLLLAHPMLDEGCEGIVLRPLPTRDACL